MQGPVHQQVVIQDIDKVGGENEEEEIARIINDECGVYPEHGHPLKVCCRQFLYQPIEIKGCIQHHDRREKDCCIGVNGRSLYEQEVACRKAGKKKTYAHKHFFIYPSGFMVVDPAYYDKDQYVIDGCDVIANYSRRAFLKDYPDQLSQIAQ